MIVDRRLGIGAPTPPHPLEIDGVNELHSRTDADSDNGKIETDHLDGRGNFLVLFDESDSYNILLQRY